MPTRLLFQDHCEALSAHLFSLSVWDLGVASSSLAAFLLTHLMSIRAAQLLPITS